MIIRVLTWLLVAVILDFFDKKLLQGKGKGIWILLLSITLGAMLSIPEQINQLIEDVLIIIIAFSTASLLAKKESTH